MRRLLGTLACVAALSACDPGGTPEDPPSPSGPTGRAQPQEDQGHRTSPAQPAWTKRLVPLTQPVVVDQVVVAVVRSARGRFDIVGLELATGREQWRHHFEPGRGIVANYAIDPSILTSNGGRHFVVFSDDDPRYRINVRRDLLAVEVATGRVAFRDRLGVKIYRAPFEPCPDGKDACSEGYILRNEPAPFRWDLDSGKVSLLPGPPQGSREVGDGLYATVERPGERLVRLEAGGALWDRSLGQAVHPRATTDVSFNVEFQEAAETYLAQIGLRPPARPLQRYQAGRPVSFRFGSFHLTVGLDAATGRTLWRAPRTDLWCMDAAYELVLPETDQTVRCLLDGRRIEQEGKDARMPRFEVTLQGFDPRTGDVTWEHELSDAFARRFFLEGVTPLAPGGIVVSTPEAVAALDLRTGELAEIDPAVTTICAGQARTLVRHSELPDGSRVRETDRGGTPLFSCNSRGRKVSSAPSEWGASAIAAGADGWRVVGLGQRIVAYDGAS